MKRLLTLALFAVLLLPAVAQELTVATYNCLLYTSPSPRDA